MKHKQGIFLRDMATGADEVVVDIIGVIGWEVAFQQMRDILRGIPEGVKRVVFDIYSPGGDVWEGNGIIHEIGELSKRVETVARVQVAASMATLIAVACSKRTMAANGRFLIHNAWTMTQGDAAAHEKAAKELRDCEIEAAAFYAARSGGKATPDKMLAVMAEEKWMTADETLALGLIQEKCDPFEPEKYDNVKKEIVAAGKWPSALAEIPVIEAQAVPPKQEQEAPKQEEKPNVHEATPDAQSDAALVAPVAAQPADDISGKLSAEYERGRIAGAAEAQVATSASLKTIEAQRLLISQLQSEKDKAINHGLKLVKDHGTEIAAIRASCDARIADMTAALKDANERMSKMLAGAMTFIPESEAKPTTWEDAMKACNNVYEDAARKYPELKAEYIRTHKQNKGR